MLDDILLLELACSASNLSERKAIVKELAQSKEQVLYSQQLSPLDNWQIKKLTGKLNVLLLKEAYDKGEVGNLVLTDLRKLLTDYKLYENNLVNLSEAHKSVFLKKHLHWLKTYQSALSALDFPQEDFFGHCWNDNEIYYEKFGKVCEPFLRLLWQRLVSLENKRIDSQVITDLQLHLLERFEMALSWAIESDINVYRAKNKLNKSTDEVQAYISYLEETFSNQERYHCFYRKFPVLTRWLSQVTRFIGDFGEVTIQRLIKDCDEIGKVFFGDKKITKIKSFKLGISDPHANGQEVIIIKLELNNIEQGTIVYKPRCIQSEVGMQGLLTKLTQDKVVEFSTYKVLPKENYGYVEFIPSDKNHARDTQEIEKFYQQLGAFLGIFHVLGGGDLHHENILAAYGNAFICDCETLLDVLPKGKDDLSETLADSVFKTALLEWPRDSIDDNREDIAIGGFSGGKSYKINYSIPHIKKCRMSLNQGVVYQAGASTELEAKNRIFYNGEIVDPQDYKESIINGFNRVYAWFQNHADVTITLVQDLFRSSSVRFINWGTQAYFQLIIGTRHPKFLVEPLEVDLFFNTLKEHRRKWDSEGTLVELELKALWQLDVPLFSVKATESKDLIYNYEHPIPNTVAISPLENAIRRIKKLSTENCIRQNQYIYTSLSTNEINSPYFINTAVNYAEQIGLEICKLLQPESSKTPWKTYEATAVGMSLVDIRGDLYAGSAGICLFLAYLDAVKPKPEFHQAAVRALVHSIEERNTNQIGTFMGTTGLVYLLIHLAQLWNQPSLLEQAVELSDELLPLICQENQCFDVLQGLAGIIPVMLTLAKTTSGKGINCAIQCAEQLLKNAIRKNNTLSWQGAQPELETGCLTGFSHGSGGIGWSLILLGCYLDEPKYIEAGRQAFAYEKTQFDLNYQNWRDLRVSIIASKKDRPPFTCLWCNGAAGIGLSRIASWTVLRKNDDDILRDAQIALNTTLRNFNELDNDSLCHGKSGNTELLLRFAKLRNQPYLQMEANVQAQAQWRSFEKNHQWICGGGSKYLLPDLMLGIAGIGMQFLRLAYPDYIPSPLLLDPPPQNNALC